LRLKIDPHPGGIQARLKEPIMRHKTNAVFSILLPALLAACTSNGVAANAPPPNLARPAALAQSAGLPDFSALAARVGPSVVNISTDRVVGAGLQVPQQPFDKNDPFYEFFKRFQFQFPIPRETPQHGIGSGFIISPDGYILTNAHVVNGATDVSVKLTDRREFKAKVVGNDPQEDVALLKIDASGLPAVQIGDPSTLKVGQWVIAVGSPFGFDNSVTAGIVSAMSRSLPDSGYVPFIQTDVAVNPGNSGGPLFNLDGQVVGINSQIYSRNGGYMGLSFAIPIDLAMKVKGDLQRYGKVTHGRLGITIQSVTPDLATSFGLKKPVGARVSAVEDNSPAARAGVEPGDIILDYDGKDIAQSSDLPRLVGETKPGAHATLRLWRDGALRIVAIIVGEMPAEQLASTDESAQANSGKLGLTVRPLSGEERRQMHEKGGLLVEEAHGVAALAGVQPGDVVLALNGEPVGSVAQLRRLLDQSRKHVALLLKRDQGTIYVAINLG
jgi:serine protease Do